MLERLVVRSKTQMVLSVAFAAAILLASVASASMRSIKTIEEQTEESELVVHLSVTRASRIDAADGPCGIVYRADVHDVLKGRPVKQIEFFSGFGATDFDIGLDTIVFLIDRKSPAERNLDFAGVFDVLGDRPTHAKTCLKIVPRLIVSDIMVYTVARTDPTLDIEHENGSDTEVRKWHDEHLMLRVSDHIDTRNIQGVREIRVKTVSVNGKLTDVDNLSGQGWLPQQIETSVTLAPVNQIKEQIRRAASKE